MPHPLILLLVFGLFTATLHADTDREVYDEADGIFKQAEEAVGTNLATFVQANEKPLAEAREEMAELIARMNKEGRSQLATSLQKRLNGLEETVQKRVRSEVPIVVPPKKPLLERLAGKWDRTDHPDHLCMHANGMVECVHDGNGEVFLRGKLTLVSPHVASIVWDNGYKELCRIAGDDDAMAMFSWNPDGRRLDGYCLERMK